MEQIQLAVESDISHIMSLMHGAVCTGMPHDWYVTDDEEFVRRHIGEAKQTQDLEMEKASFWERNSEGYTLKYIIDGELAAFLIVRHPREAEDNLGQELWKMFVEVSPERQGEHVAINRMPADRSTRQELLQRTAHMESAAVAPSHRGKGLQRKLLARAEEIEIARGTKYLMATVHPDNSYSLRNLEAAGYQCVLETEKYGGLRRKVMCKALEADN